jgi:hypothetical protein
MRNELEYLNSERHDAPWISIETWNKLDENKKANRGWVVIDYPDLKMLNELIRNHFFEAIEIDECPVRFKFDGIQQNFPCGLSVGQVKSMIYHCHRDHKEQQ